MRMLQLFKRTTLQDFTSGVPALTASPALSTESFAISSTDGFAMGANSMRLGDIPSFANATTSRLRETQAKIYSGLGSGSDIKSENHSLNTLSINGIDQIPQDQLKNNYSDLMLLDIVAAAMPSAVVQASKKFILSTVAAATLVATGDISGGDAN